MHNRKLLLLFLLLLFVFIITRYFMGDVGKSFDAEIIKLDTAQITRILLKTKADNFQEFELIKEKDWLVSSANLQVAVNEEAVQTLLSNLVSVKADQIVAKEKERWGHYDLEENTATSISVFKGNRQLAKFWVGKFTMSPDTRQITTYFRLEGKDDVFAVEGMTGLMFNQGFDGYRSNSFLELDVHAIEKLSYSGEQNYSIEKSGTGWKLNQTTELDSNAVWNFLMNLRQMTGDEFAKGFDTNSQNSEPVRTLTISGSNMPEDVVVRCWSDSIGEKPFVLQSSQYPYSFFSSDTSRLFTRVFKPISQW